MKEEKHISGDESKENSNVPESLNDEREGFGCPLCAVLGIGGKKGGDSKKKSKFNMILYLAGAVIGGLAGYLVLYRLLGCSDGACAITANPYISTGYGVIIGVLVAGIFTK